MKTRGITNGMKSAQDELKSQLKELMRIPENIICVDCGDKRPMWASLIVPPKDCPFKNSIGCFCCFQCSGAHRMMGTHICFVRSTNLDEWKEKEVMAMKDGGNALINELFQANLNDETNSTIPDCHTNLELRNTFIHDKYQHRKWYSVDAYNKLQVRKLTDSALSKLNRSSISDIEESFFASRNNSGYTGKSSLASGSTNNEIEWWKVESNNTTDRFKKSQKYCVHSNTSDQDTTALSISDRRNLTKSLQRMDSKAALLNGVAHLGIRDEKERPSEIKQNSSIENGRHRGRRNSRRVSSNPSKKERGNTTDTLSVTSQSQRSVSRSTDNNSSNNARRRSEKPVTATAKGSSHSEEKKNMASSERSDRKNKPGKYRSKSRSSSNHVSDEDIILINDRSDGRRRHYRKGDIVKEITKPVLKIEEKKPQKPLGRSKSNSVANDKRNPSTKYLKRNLPGRSKSSSVANDAVVTNRVKLMFTTDSSLHFSSDIECKSGEGKKINNSSLTRGDRESCIKLFADERRETENRRQPSSNVKSCSPTDAQRRRRQGRETPQKT